ncbi:trace amine-associated receptor 1-like [Centroberyx affinis]|uniref:trace amine-associated receptor 1-like n=1 Tax=Centroberyx affinis TaxID=166261 RepID=UPI003A5BB3E8
MCKDDLINKQATIAYYDNLRRLATFLQLPVQKCPYSNPVTAAGLKELWQEKRADVIGRLRSKDHVVVLGHCAQYCTYTTIEQESKDIIHIVTVDKRETNRNSVIMEKEGFIQTMDIQSVGNTRCGVCNIPLISGILSRQMESGLCFESRNTSCLRTIYPLSVRVSLYLFLGVMVVLTVCGNVLVVMSVAQFKQLHTPTNYLILSLAVSDLLLGLLVMVPSMIRCVETCWYFGDVFCKVYNSADVLLSTASILNLSFISIDRYYAVCQPLLYRSKITVNAVLIMILVSWSVSAVVGFGMIFLKLNILGIEEFYYTHVACEGGCVLFQSGVSSTVSSVLSFYIPGVVMLGIYLKIFLVAQRQVRSIHNTKTSDPSQTKATKTLAIIMGAFLSFWTPFFVCNIIDPFISYSTPSALFETLLWVGYLNSTVNPLVYAFFYSWFRKAFRVIISRKIFNSDISDIKLFTE